MTTDRKTWAIVLAAGEGTRLRQLTGHPGGSIPKQYCSLAGGRSLLQATLARAGRLAPRKRIVVVVAEEHREHWSVQLAGLPPGNVVVQPVNRGTAAGLLLPLLAVLERAPAARVVFLPSDHHVGREDVLEASLRIALDALDEPDAGVTLLGIHPDAPEPGYGWIVPARGPELLRRVACFVEKPEAPLAERLQAQGAVWNSFLMAGAGAAFLELYRRRVPGLVERMEAARGDPDALRALYATLGTSDFSRELLQGSEPDLRLAVVPACGWTDLGTPERVAACLAALRPVPRARVAGRSGPFDLALALERLRGGLGERPAVVA
jgi:mannose-1-phosphate guanylyltransferase